MNYGKKGAKKRQSELTSKGVVFRKKLAAFVERFSKKFMISR